MADMGLRRLKEMDRLFWAGIFQHGTRNVYKLSFIKSYTRRVSLQTSLEKVLFSFPSNGNTQMGWMCYRSSQCEPCGNQSSKSGRILQWAVNSCASSSQPVKSGDGVSIALLPAALGAVPQGTGCGESVAARKAFEKTGNKRSHCASRSEVG